MFCIKSIVWLFALWLWLGALRAGIWEVLFVIVVSHNTVVLRLDNWFWRGSYFGATSVLQYSVFPLAMESVFQACEVHRALLPPSFPLAHLVSPPVPSLPLPRSSHSSAPFPLSFLCNPRLLELSCVGAACSLYAAGVVLSVALGVILGGYAGYGLLSALNAQSRVFPSSLVQVHLSNCSLGLSARMTFAIVPEQVSLPWAVPELSISGARL